MATVNDNDELRRKTAEEWSSLYKQILARVGIVEALKPEDINCAGCRSEGLHFAGCIKCSIRECCRERGLCTCASCKEYESCDLLEDFYSLPPHQYAKEKLDRIRSGL